MHNKWMKEWMKHKHWIFVLKILFYCFWCRQTLWLFHNLSLDSSVMSLLSSVYVSLIITIFDRTNQQFLITKCWNIRLVFPCHIISNFELMYDNTELSKTVKIWRNSHQHSPTQQHSSMMWCGQAVRAGLGGHSCLAGPETDQYNAHKWQQLHSYS